MVAGAGFEPAYPQDMSLVPYRLANPQCCWGWWSDSN